MMKYLVRTLFIAVIIAPRLLTAENLQPYGHTLCHRRLPCRTLGL